MAHTAFEDVPRPQFKPTVIAIAMHPQDPNDGRRNPGGRRLPRWAGYLLIAADVVCQPLFLACWLATLVALWMTLPADSLRIQIAVLAIAAVATPAAATRAAAIQAAQRGALGAYVARLAATTSFGRCLTDFLNGRSD
ncbi:hypothetical protein [Salinisphaera sp.]|uniref:hypothetical protein n=1 Tax=Salinisphaera sp. TaxID=1914330 RepID=UPI002D76C4DB|nr:hypothetical protein [Salinisphaera sp.]HET7315165.1 hypothetical protein [Salinisphaera sp.]